MSPVYYTHKNGIVGLFLWHDSVLTSVNERLSGGAGLLAGLEKRGGKYYNLHNYNLKYQSQTSEAAWKWGSAIIKDSHSHFYFVLSADLDLLTIDLIILHLKHSMVVLKGHLSASVALKTTICSCVKSVIETYEAVFPCSVSTLRRNSPCWLGSAVEGMMM